MAKTQVRVGIKVAQMTVLYDDAREAWLEADRLGFEPCWLHERVLTRSTQPGTLLVCAPSRCGISQAACE